MDNSLGSGPATATDAAGSPVIRHRDVFTGEMLSTGETQRIRLGASEDRIEAGRAAAAAAAAFVVRAKVQRVSMFRQTACAPIGRSPSARGQDLQAAHTGIAGYLGACDLASTHAVCRP